MPVYVYKSDSQFIAPLRFEMVRPARVELA